MDCSLPGVSVHGILQARVLEWVVIAFSETNFASRINLPSLFPWHLFFWVFPLKQSIQNIRFGGFFFYQILKPQFSLKLLCASVLTYISKVIRSVYQLQFSGYEIWIFEFKLYHSAIWLRREECSISYLTESSSQAREIAVTVQVFPRSQSACA